MVISRSSSSEESHPGESGSESGHETDEERSKATSRASSHEGYVSGERAIDCNLRWTSLTPLFHGIRNSTSEKVDLDNEVKRELAKLVREDDWIQVRARSIPCCLGDEVCITC